MSDEKTVDDKVGDRDENYFKYIMDVLKSGQTLEDNRTFKLLIRLLFPLKNTPEHHAEFKGMHMKLQGSDFLEPQDAVEWITEKWARRWSFDLQDTINLVTSQIVESKLRQAPQVPKKEKEIFFCFL